MRVSRWRYAFYACGLVSARAPGSGGAGRATAPGHLTLVSLDYNWAWPAVSARAIPARVMFIPAQRNCRLGCIGCLLFLDDHLALVRVMT